jgi:hypothetical protein
VRSVDGPGSLPCDVCCDSDSGHTPESQQIFSIMGVSLNDFPFDQLRLHSGEQAQWKAHGCAHHRSTQYGIVLTNRALHLRSAVWFASWRSIPLIHIRHTVFNDSRLWPSLRVETSKGTEFLRTPWDDPDEMALDRVNLRTAAVKVRDVLTGAAGVA